MKRLLIYAASLVLALALAPAYGSSHGHDSGMDSMEEDGKAMEEHREEAMDRGAHQGPDIEELPPTAAGQESEGGMDDTMQDNMDEHGEGDPRMDMEEPGSEM
ncbi:hypothetical protein [Marinobacter sp. F4216]|uniref:hypothetical protein n=1 Tax=Marinobacter sp. F4216 TaxID=2874281 RepID=UPI001CBF22B1|nr:hypothetical protein [Marinobacter sp. F4216]MBZ2167408.1 hypothetical protein [Marinobacter sp. F4216]